MSFMVNQLIGFGARRGSTGVPTSSYVGEYTASTAASTSFTISVSTGTAVTGRRIVCGFGAYVPGGGSRTLSSATIDGNSATIAAQITGTNVHCGIVIAQVDSNTSGNVVLTWDNNVQYITLYIWRIIDLTTTTAYATATNATVSGGNLSSTLNVPANGLVYCMSFTIDGSPTVPTFSAGVTKDDDTLNGSSTGAAGGSASYGSAQTPLTVTSGLPGTRSAFAVASYGN